MPRVSPAPSKAQDWITAPGLTALLVRVAVHYRLGPVDFDDLAQETRIALWEAGAELVGAAWVLRVACYKAVDLIRRRTRVFVGDQTYAFLSKRRTAEPDIERLLHARVAALPAPLQTFYDLHYLQGWSEREIATRLGKCRASIRWLDRRCRRRIIGLEAE